jgi:hypothetical protein
MVSTADARAAKERKQKIFVAVGGVVLLALLAFQLPKLLGGSESSTAAPAAETTAVGGETTPGAQTPAATTAAPVALVDTDRPLALGPGQLRSFTVFTRKDPFVQQIVSKTPAAAAGSAGQSGAKETPEDLGFKVGASAAAVTLISVNGARQALVPGATFPSADPIFVLVAEQPDAKSVVIGVAGGEYASGAQTTKLRVGKPLVLVNTTTGARYRLVLVAVGDGQAAGPSAADEKP